MTGNAGRRYFSPPRKVQYKLSPVEIQLFREEADLIRTARCNGVLPCDLKQMSRILYGFYETPGPLDQTIRDACNAARDEDRLLDLDDDY